MKYRKQKYYFTKEHEWIRFENNIAFVGLTNLAKTELGPIINIEIHTVGKDLMENEVFGTIRTRKYLCKLIMPVRGKVLESNAIKYDKFNTINKNLDKDDWIAKIAVSLPLKSKSLYKVEEHKSINTERVLYLIKYFLKSGE